MGAETEGETVGEREWARKVEKERKFSTGGKSVSNHKKRKIKAFLHLNGPATVKFDQSDYGVFVRVSVCWHMCIYIEFELNLDTNIMSY